jgi:hypothetical protein
MIWLNLKTTTLRSPEYAGSEPIQRATWLNLLAYCCEQENGGKIDGCGEWKDRQWQQTLGVTLAEVRQDCALWHWEDGALCVAFYPTDKQEEVKAKRDAGKRGGSAKTQAKTQAARDNGAKHNPSKTQAKPKQNPSSNPTEREGKGNDKGKIKEDTGRSEEVVSTPTLPEWVEMCHRAQIGKDIAEEIWHDNEGRGISPHGYWLDYQGNPIRNPIANATSRAAAIARRRSPVVPINGHNGHAKPESVWSLQQRIEAAQKEVDRICANPANKEAVPDSFDRRLKAEPMAKVKALKASISEMRQRLAGVGVAA